MSVATAKAQLRTILQSITADYGNGELSLVKVYDNPREATSIGEFPVAIIALAPMVAHNVSQETGGSFGLVRHDYTLRVWLIVGQRQTPIGELASRCEAWVEPVIAALADNLTLNDVVTVIGNGADALATYTEQTIQWGLTDNEPTFYGLRWDIPISEMLSLQMNP